MTKCPIETCPLDATSLGLCAGHFKLIPAPIKSEIYQLVKRHKGGPSHVKAIRRACLAVNGILEGWKRKHQASAQPASLPYRDD